MKTSVEMVSRIPVYHKDGSRLQDTTPSRARKLIKGNQAKSIKKDGVFSLQMLVDTRKE